MTRVLCPEYRDVLEAHDAWGCQTQRGQGMKPTGHKGCPWQSKGLVWWSVDKGSEVPASGSVSRRHCGVGRAGERGQAGDT